jgi:hypothetical protein
MGKYIHKIFIWYFILMIFFIEKFFFFEKYQDKLSRKMSEIYKNK